MRKLSKNKWLAILTTLLMVFSLFPIGAMAAVDCEPYYETPLYAGQDIEVGKVIVTNSDGKLCIKYELSEEALEEGWLIYETHWAAGKELSDIPQTPGNQFGTNPIPGQFPYGDSELDGVPFYTECIDWPDGWEIGDELFIAAHAVVKKTECIITADETAWGEGTRFNQRGNWGWYFKYKICEPIIPPPDIVRFPLDGNAYVGYEDRLTSSDFDYNDFGMKMELEETYADGILQSVFMKFTAVVNDAGDVHDIHIARPYKGDYVYTITRSVPAVGTETAAGTDLLGSGNFDIVLFDTGNFPGMTGPDLTASVTIEITMDEANNQNLLTDYGIAPRFDLDSVFSLYNPYMANRTQVGSILLTSMFEIEPGVNAPLILVVPKTDWIPPAEGVNIATVYGDFINYYDTELAMYEDWFI